MNRVTNQDLLSQLNSSNNMSKVSDPDILKELNQPYDTGSALGTFGRTAARQPFNIYNEAQKIFGMPETTIPDYLKPQESDSEHPLAKTLGGIPELGAEYFLFKKARPLIQALRGAGGLYSKINEKPAQEQANQAAQAHGAAESDLKAFSDFMKEHFGTGSEPALKRKINQTTEAKQDLSQFENVPEENLNNLLPGATGENLVPEAEAQTAAHERETSDYLLGPNEEHHVEFAREMVPMHESNKADVSAIYKNIEQNLEGKNIALPNPADAKQITQQLQEVIKRGGMGSKEAITLAKQLETVGKKDIVPAKDFFSSFRNTRQVASRIRHSAYGQSAEEFDRRMAKADEMDELADAMQKHLQAAPFGEEILGQLAEANHRWATEVKPVEKNSLFAQMAKTGRPSGNILSKLAGNETGNHILHWHMEQNPRALRAALGQTYARNPRGLLNATPRHRGYVEHLPALEGMLNRIRSSLQNEQVAARRAQHLRDEARRVQGEFEARQRAQKGRKELEKKNEELKKLQKAEKEYVRLRNKKESTLKEKMHYDEELAKIKETKKKVMGAIHLLAGYKAVKLIGLI